MDTRRCLSCHKLLRADANKCSLCGYTFSQAPVRRSNKVTNASYRLATASVPSNPPASPHRTGHYSGLHPEDQPYQSSFMPIMRPTVITRRLPEQEADEAFLPVAAFSTSPQPGLVAERQHTPNRHIASPIPSPQPVPQRYAATLSPMAVPVPLPEVEKHSFAPETTLHEQITAPLLASTYLPSKHQSRSHIVRVLLLASCLSFLLATGILAYGLRVGAPAVTIHTAIKADPTRNQQGQSVPPTLQLSTNQVDFGANVQGAITSKKITLTNMGKGHIAWQAGTNSSWLAISPVGGTFSSSMITNLTVNRTNMAPGEHLGYITFIQQGNTSTTLKVTMSVNPLAAIATAALPPPPTLTAGPLPSPAMTISSNVLTFSTIQGIDPSPQHLTISNAGNTPLDWAITQDPSITSFLTVSPTNGITPAANSAAITVTPNVSTAKAGTIVGQLIILGKGTPALSQRVNVTITISNQAVITVSNTGLVFNSTSTRDAPAQLLTITNTGSAQLNWTLSGLPSWLQVDIPSGTLPPNQSTFVTITPDSTGLSASTYSGILVVSDIDPKTPVISQHIQVTLIVK